MLSKRLMASCFPYENHGFCLYKKGKIIQSGIRPALLSSGVLCDVIVRLDVVVSTGLTQGLTTLPCTFQHARSEPDPEERMMYLQQPIGVWVCGGWIRDVGGVGGCVVACDTELEATSSGDDVGGVGAGLQEGGGIVLRG